MPRFVTRLALPFAAVAMLIASAQPARAIPVAIELSLLIDVSGSVDNNEFLLQRSGYVQAFQSATIQNLIANTPGGIAVNFIVWSGAAEQSQQVGWTHITDATSANAFATAVNTATRSGFAGLTAPGSALNFAVPLFNNNFEGDRQVIDVSGDGEENDGVNTATARNNALTAGVDQINGLAIGGAALAAWYAANIQGGAGSFTIQANDFNDFAAAIEQKLFRELGGVPVPPGIVLVGTGLVSLLGYNRRRRMLAAA